jgi:hypothetical protein
VDPKVITAPGEGDSHLVLGLCTGEAVKWGADPSGAPIAGVTLGYYGPTVIRVLGIPIPAPVPSSAFIGDITDYLEEWQSGYCPAVYGGCHLETPCWFRISYTITSAGSQYDGPIEWTSTSTGGVTETETLVPGDPSCRTVDVNMYCSPACDRHNGGSVQVTQDMGALTQTRVFQKLEMSCTTCN